VAAALTAQAPATTGEEDTEPLTRTEAALLEKLRRRLPSSSDASDPLAPTAAGQRLNAAAFLQRMNTLRSRLSEDESGEKSG
jgi:hypothetical protein